MRCERGSWHPPHGELEGHGESSVFGVGGEIEGELARASSPHRRPDGVRARNLRRVLSARTGDEMVVAVHGQSGRCARRAPRGLAREELTTEAPRFRWLDTCFLVGEGAIDENRDGVRR